MPTLRSIALAGVTLLACACEGKEKLPREVRSALETAEVFELFSLEPHQAQGNPADQFHGWKMLGTTVVTDVTQREKLIAVLRKGTTEHDGTFANCFNPRHGIRVTNGGTTTDLVICFECFWVEVYRDGERVGGFATPPYPESVFDSVFLAA